MWPALGKHVTADALLAGIRTVTAGEALRSPGATRALITRFLTALAPGARDRAQLVVIAHRTGLVRPASPRT